MSMKCNARAHRTARLRPGFHQPRTEKVGYEAGLHRPRSARKLEQVPQRELHLAAVVHLLRNPAKRTTAVWVHHARAVAGTRERAPVRVVQPVERFGAELHLLPLADGDVLEQRQVVVLFTRVAEDVAQAGGREGSRGGLAEET